MTLIRKPKPGSLAAAELPADKVQAAIRAAVLKARIARRELWRRRARSYWRDRQTE